MRKVLRINPKTHLVCIPEEMVVDGMVGNVDSYPNAVTLTLVTPGASLRDVEASLERTLDDIKHRIRFKGREASGEPDSPAGKEESSKERLARLRAKLQAVLTEEE